MNEYIDIVTKRYNAARNNQLPWFTKFAVWYSLYRGNQSHKNYDGRSNLFIPASFWTVESYVPKITRALRKIIAVPQEPTDEENAKAVSALLEYQQEEIGWYDFFKQWVRTAGIYGSAPAKVTWEYKKGEYDRPCLKLVDKLDFFYDPNGDSQDDWRWVIHKTTRHIDDLKYDKKYKNVDKIMPRNSGPYDADGFKSQRKTVLSVSQKPVDSSSKLVDIYEFWGFIGKEGEQEKNMLITVANKNTIIREEENPFKDILPGNALPFVLLYDLDVPFEVEGIGEIEPIEKLQEELNDTRNQRMDNVTLILNRMWEVVRSANVEEEDMVSMPGRIFRTNIPNGIREITTPDVTRSAYEEERLIKEDIQQTSVGSSSVDIAATKRSETATGILATQDAGDTRTESKVLNMRIAVKKLWRMILALDQHFLDKDFVVRIKGQAGTGFQKMKPADIQGNHDIDVEVESQQNRLVKKQEAMQLYQLALQTPNANIPKAYKDLMELYDKQNPDEYILPPPPPQPPVPAISVSMRGELPTLATLGFAKMAGLDPQSADPMQDPVLARAMFPDSEEGPTHMERAHPDSPDNPINQPPPSNVTTGQS